MTYNSNHMEGSTLSEEQTRLIFETNTIDAEEGIPVDDILETVHHFRAIDYVIDHAEDLLTEDFIKELHLTAWNAKNDVSIIDIISFHSDFEHIHPFQDGNGRVGRLIALKECLHWNVVPFIIEDVKKSFYYRGLSEWKNEKGYLIDTCLDGQDTFRKLLVLFDVDAD